MSYFDTGTTAGRGKEPPVAKTQVTESLAISLKTYYWKNPGVGEIPQCRNTLLKVKVLQFLVKRGIKNSFKLNIKVLKVRENDMQRVISLD